MTLDPVFNWIIALALVQLFASAAWHKFSNLTQFRQTLNSYRILPQAHNNSGAFAIACIECLAVLLLIIPSSRAEGAWLAALLLSGYATVMAINLMRSRTLLDCGCHFGPQKQPVTWFLVVRNLLLSTLALLASLPAADRIMNPLDFGSVLFGLSLCSLLYVTSNSLSQNNELIKNG